MASKALILSFFLIFSSLLVHQGSSGLISAIWGGNILSHEQKCVDKMKACFSSMKSFGFKKPGRECCESVKKMISNDTECYCKFYENDQLRRAAHVSKDNVARLPKACGDFVDHSRCYTGGSLATAPVSPWSSGKMITPYRIIHFGVPGFVALLTALVFSTY